MPAKLPKPLEPYLAQFWLAALHGGWGLELWATHLALALEGTAEGIVGTPRCGPSAAAGPPGHNQGWTSPQWTAAVSSVASLDCGGDVQSLGFLAELNSVQGQNYESQVFRAVCQLLGSTKRGQHPSNHRVTGWCSGSTALWPSSLPSSPASINWT